MRNKVGKKIANMKLIRVETKMREKKEMANKYIEKLQANNILQMALP